MNHHITDIDKSQKICDDCLAAIYIAFCEYGCGSAGNMCISANDHIYYDHRIVDEDVDDLIMSVLRRCGRRLPSKEIVASFSPMHTIKDIITFIHICPTV